MSTILIGQSYKVVDGTIFKLCAGPLHKDEGEWLTLDRYFIMKKGRRANRPIPMCKACERMKRFGTTERGLVEVQKVWWVFEELERRVGRTETCRRVGVSANFWKRVENRVYTRMYKRTAIKAVRALREARLKGEVRHRDSIKHGASLRGHEEKVPIDPRDFYKRDWKS